MSVAVYRVVNRHGEIAAEYVKGPYADGSSWRRALAHAARIDGRIFHVDEHGYLELVYGQRERIGGTK